MRLAASPYQIEKSWQKYLLLDEHEMGVSAGGKVTASVVYAFEITLNVLGTCLGTCNSCHDNSILKMIISWDFISVQWQVSHRPESNKESSLP